MAQRTITLMALSKNYSVPGLACSLAIIPNAALRSRFAAVMRRIVSDVNVPGLAAAEAAYTECDAWRDALIGALRANRDYVEASVTKMPGLSMTHVEATYLAWIDARPAGRATVAFLRGSRRRLVGRRRLRRARLGTAQLRLPARDALGRSAANGLRLR
jgi:cystathionine beta-lyase